MQTIIVNNRFNFCFEEIYCFFFYVASIEKSKILPISTVRRNIIPEILGIFSPIMTPAAKNHLRSHVVLYRDLY